MRLKRDCLATLGSALALCLAAPSFAVTQEADESALDDLDKQQPPPVAIKVEPPGAVELRDAIRRIAVRPTDSYALTDAGYASLKLGDADAAFNFFTRAGNLQPSDARIKAGLASAMVRRENPFEALRLFDEAARMGASESGFAMDRAIAFDLLGNFERAQQDYQKARNYGQSDELIRRQALSLSLLGKAADADAMLYPLLQRDDPEAWRARSFMLAARGEVKDAEKIALSFLSEAEARRMEYYFRQMPRLTPAQQAAALHFGNFPLGSNIGQDSEQVRSMASAMGVKPRPVAVSGRLVPSGEQLGSKTTKGRDNKPSKASARDVRTAKRGGSTPPIATASAQAAIDRAAVAVPRAVPGAQMPPPETARPLVRIVLPAARTPVPTVMASAVVPAPVVKPPVPVAAAASNVAIRPNPEPVAEIKPIAVPPSNQPPLFSTTQSSGSPAIAELPPVGPAVVPAASLPPSVLPPSGLPPVVPVGPPILPPASTLPPVMPVGPPLPGLTNMPAKVEPTMVDPPKSPEPLPTSEPAKAIAVASATPAMAPTIVAPVPSDTGQNLVKPGMDVLAGPANPIETPKAVFNSPAIVPQGPNIDGTVVDAPVIGSTIPDATKEAEPQRLAVAEPTVSNPPAEAPIAATKPAIVFTPTAAKPEAPAPEQSATGFDLGSVIDAIAIPEQEQQRTVAAVDLKKIKPLPPKTETMPATAKGAKDAKAPANPARFWVQIATGSDINGLAFDYRRQAKKSPALFANLAGHTSAWGKSRRLLVGPFVDMKIAKKWEGDFRKGGGDGFVWQSANGVEVDPLKGK
jgi:Flp pilus assembly protein TadD